MNIRNLLSLLLATIAATLSFGAKPVISIIQVVEHPSLDHVRVKAIEELEKHGIDKNSISYQNAGGNLAMLAQIASSAIKKNPDVIFAIGTSAAQLATKRNSKIPVIFGPVTDPVAGGLVTSTQTPGKNVTGVSDKTDYEQLIKTIKALYPHIKKVGVPLNTGELNSLSTFKEIEAIANKEHFSAYKVPVRDIAAASASLKSAIANGIELIILPQDNTIATAVRAITRICDQHKIPAFSTYSDAVSEGACASLGVDYRQLGEIAGQTIMEVLRGKVPGSIPVKFLQPRLLLSRNFEKLTGRPVPEAWKARADFI